MSPIKILKQILAALPSRRDWLDPDLEAMAKAVVADVNPDEKNPEHPVTESMRHEWHKIAALLMLKLGEDHIVITAADVDKLVTGDKKNIVIKEMGNGLNVVLLDDATAMKMLEDENRRMQR